MPLEVFYSYAHEDEKLRDKLEKQLSLLQRNGLIVGWHDRRIGAGGEWDKEIDAHIHSAHIILLLISADFIASDYSYGIEMRIALERQAKHEAVVIPIILRPVDWSGAPFARLQALPRDGKPITTWHNEDEAFAEVARGIREVVTRIEVPTAGGAISGGELVDRFTPKPRVVDAAMPSHIVKGVGTTLLVLIRLPDSAGLRGILQHEDEAEARPEDVRSRPFSVTFPVGPTGRPDPLKVSVDLTCPDFSPPKQAKNIFVPPEADSDVCPFMLTANRVGQLSVLVELQWEDAVRGYRRLLTMCVAEATEIPAPSEMNLVRMNVSAYASPARNAVAAAPPPPAPARAVPPPLPRDMQAPAAVLRDDHTPATPVPAPWLPKKLEKKRLDRIRRDKGDTDLVWLPPTAKSPAPDSAVESADERRERLRSDTQRVPVATPSRPKSLFKNPIVIALIGTVPIVFVIIGYWQITRQGGVPNQVVLSGQVLNAQTKEVVADARVTVVFENGTGPLEGYTDSHGNFSFRLNDVKRGSRGTIYLNAPNYDGLEKNFEVTSPTLHDELTLEPSRKQPRAEANRY